MNNNAENLQTSGRIRPVRSFRALALQALVLIALAVGLWTMLHIEHKPVPVSKNDTESDSLPEVSSAETSASSKEQLSADAQKLVGKWQLKQAVQREIDIRPDGTATMKVTLDYLTGLIYGRHLTLHLNWNLQDGLLTQTVVGGTPPENVNKITKAFGNSLSYQVVKINSDEMVLKGPSGAKTFENWEALKPVSE